MHSLRKFNLFYSPPAFPFPSQLATRVAFHDHLLPVCLPPTDMKELAAGTRCTVIGWGKKEDKNREFILAGIFISSEFAFQQQENKLFVCTLTGIQFPFEFFAARSTHRQNFPPLFGATGGRMKTTLKNVYGTSFDV